MKTKITNMPGEMKPMAPEEATAAIKLAESLFSSGALDDVSLVVEVISSEDSEGSIYVGTYFKQLKHEGNSVALSLISRAMPSVLGLKSLTTNPSIIGQISINSKVVDLPPDLADYIFLGLEQLQSDEDLVTHLDLSEPPPPMEPNLSANLASRFSLRKVLTAELRSIPPRRWRVSMKERSGFASELETTLTLLNEDAHEAAVVLARATDLARSQGNASESPALGYSIKVSNHAQAEKAAGRLSAEEIKELFEHVLTEVNLERKRFGQKFRIQTQSSTARL